jgi:autotransporter-associated beta strand protein
MRAFSVRRVRFSCFGNQPFISPGMKNFIPLPSFLPARFVACLVLAAVFVLAPSSVFAQGSNTWDGGGANGNWSTAANWSGDTPIPGATSGNSSTDVATFNAAVANNQIVIDANRNIGGLTFNGSGGNYTIGSTGGNALHMSNATTILIGNGLITNNTTININAPLLMYGGLTINNVAPNNTNKFVIGGTISSATSGNKLLVITSNGTNSSNINEITGLISDGNGVVSVTQSTAGGIWRLLNDGNTFTGNLGVTGGSLSVSSIGNRGDASAAGAGTTINFGSTTSGGSLIYLGGAATTNRTINMAGTTGGGTIVQSGSGLLLLTSNITVTGNGSKTLALRGTGAGEIAGTIVNSALTGATVATAASTSNTTLALASVDGLTVGNGISGTGIAGGTTISAIDAANKRVTLSAAATVASGATITSSGLVNITSVTKSEAGTWTLSGNNTYTGATTVSGGTLQVGGLLGGGSYSGNISISNSNSGAFIYNGSNSQTLSGVISGAGAFTKNNTSTLTLSGANTYTGNTTINAGNLTLSGGSAISDSGNVTLANAAGAILHVAQSETIGSLSGGGASGGNVSIAGGQSLGITAASTFNGSISGAGGLVKSGAGDVTLSGNNTYTGGTTITNSNLIMGASNALGNGALTLDGTGAIIRLNLNGTNQTITSLSVLGANSAVIQNEGSANALGTLTFNIADGVTSSSTSSFIFRDKSSGNGTLALVKTGNGTLDFSAINTGTYTGGLTVNQGVFSWNDIKGLGSASNLITLGGGTLNYTGASGSSVSTTNTNMSLTAGTTSTLNNANGTVTISAIIAGSGNLTKTGAGTLTLSSANTYSGDTLVSAGTLTLSNALALQNSTIDTSGAGVITLSSVTTPTFGGLKGSGNLSSVITTGYSSATGITLNPGSGVSNTYSGVISNGAAGMTLTKNGSGTQVLSGANTYTGTTTINAGNLTLTGGSAIFDTGAVTLANTAGAILHVAQSETIGSLSGGGASGGYVSIAASQSLTINGTSSTTFSGIISGSGGLVKSGNRTLTLSGNNTYTGGTTINNAATDSGSVLSMGSNNALGNGALTINASGWNTFLRLNGTNQTITSLTLLGGNVSVIENQGGGNGTITFNLADGVTSNSTSTLYFRDSNGGTGTLALVKTGNGTLNFSTIGIVGYSGGLAVNGGVFSYNAAGQLGSGAITLGGGTLNYTGASGSSVSTANTNMALTAGTTSTLNNANGTVTISAIIAGSGNLTKTGAGTLTLSGANTYTGDTLVSGSGSQIRANTVSAFGTGNVTITTTGASAGALVDLRASGTFANNFTINGTGTANGAIQGNANSTLSGLVTLAGDAMIASRSSAGNSTLTLTGGITSGGTNRTLTLNTFGNATVAGNQLTISGNSVNLGTGGTLDIGHGLQAGGTGTFNLNVGNNTWGTTIVRGFASTGNSSTVTLNIGDANALGGSGAVLQLGNSTTSLEQITVNLNGNNQTIGGLRSFGSTGSASVNGTRTVTSATAATLTIDNSSATNYLYDGVISGDISLTKNGTATQTLTRNNTFTGATTINGGVLNIRANDALGTTAGGTSVATGASLQLQGDITVGAEALSLSGSGASDGGALRNISGNNSYGGAITLAGATRINSDSNLLTLSGGISGNTQNLTVGGSGNTTISGAVNLSSGSLTKDGGSTTVLTLGASNTYTGGTTIRSGTISLGANNALGNGSLTFDLPSGSNSFLRLNGTNQTITGLTINASTSQSVIENNGGGSGVLTINLAEGVTSSSTSTTQIIDIGSGGTGTLALVKTGNGTLDFSTTGTINYSGGLTVNGGNLSYTNVTALGNSTAGGAITLGGGTLNYTGSSSLTVANNATLTDGTTSTLNNAAGTVTVSGTIGGSGNMTKSGAGTLVLSGANSYAGTTIVSEGVLTITTNSTLPGLTTNGRYSVANGATLGVYNAVTDADIASMLNTTNFAAGSAIGFDTTSANRTYANVIANTTTGALGVTKLGSNTLTLNGSNTYTGATTISAGTLQIGAGSTTGSISSSSDITNNGTLAINRSNDLTLANTISGSGALTKAGAGNLTLSGSNSYAGNTTISAGAVLIQNANALGTTAGGTIVSSGGSLRLQGGITVAGEALSLSGNGSNSDGTGALRNISGNNTWTGNITSSAATTFIASDSGLLTLSGNMSITNGTWPYTFTGSGNTLVSGNISGTGSSGVSKLSTGTLTLTGNNTFSGNISASAGTVSISSIGNVGEASAAGAGTTINIGGQGTNGILLYTGSAATSNKTINLASGNTYSSTITQNGTGLLKFTSDFTATVGGNKTLILNGSGLGEIAGAIVNNTGNLTSLTKNGTGTWTLSGNNTYSGATTVNAGTLNLTGNNSASATTINSGGTLIGTGTAGAVTVNSGGMIGAGNASGAVGTLTTSSLTINADSGYTLTIGNVNSFTAGTDYDQISTTGALALNNTGTNPFTIYLDGTPTGWSNSGNYTWNIISAASQTGFNSGNFALNFSSFGIDSSNRTGLWNFTNPSTGIISLTYTASAGDSIWSGGTGNWTSGFSAPPTTDQSITFSGAGGGVATATNNIPSANLSAVNFITFNSTAGAYTLNATAGAAGLSGGTPLTVKGDIINNSASTQTINMDLALLTSSTGIINTASGNIAIGGVISGAGDLTKTGNGTLVLSGNNAFTGQLTVAEGTLSIATLNNSSVSGVLGNSTNSVVLGSSGKNGTLSYTGGATLSVNKTFTMAAGGTGVFDIGGGQLTVGAISGSGALSKTGAGILVLGSANTYSGGTTLGGSGLVAVSVSSTGSAGSPTNGAFGTGMVTLAGAQLRAGTSDNRTVANAITISADTTFATATDEKSLTFTGPVTLSGATRTLNVLTGTTNSTAVLTFSGAIGDGGNGYGITKNGGGQLTLSGNNTYSGGTIINAGRFNVTTASGFGTGNVTIASGAFTGITLAGTMTNNFTIAGSGSANGAIQSFGTNTTLSGLVTLAGDAMIATRTSAGNGNLNLTGGITSGGTNRTLTLNAFGNATVAGNQLTISTNSVNLGAGGTLDIGAGLGAGGTGTFNLNVDNNTWGTTIVRAFNSAGNSSAITLNLGAANALGSSSSVLQLGNSTTSLEQITVNLNGNNQTIGGLRSFGFGSTGSASANGTRTVTSATAATLTIDNSSATNYLYDGVISGNISLVKNGTATQTLTGNNTYTGATTINGGNLSISTVSAVADTSGINLSNATSLIYTGSAATLDRAISVTAGTGTIRNTGGALTLTGGLSKNGTTLTFDSGTFNVNTIGISGSAANSDLVIDGATVNLDIANNYNGPTSIIDGGTLNANFTGALPTSTRTAVSIDATGTGSSTLALGASQSIASLTGAASSNVTLSSNTLTIGSSSNAVSTTYAGRITGGSTSALVKDGASTQILTGNNTGFTGTTTINSGTLQAAATGALGGTTNIDVNGGSLLVAVANAVNSNANINLGGGTLAVSGNFNQNVGLLTLSADSIIDLNGFSGILRFGGVGSWASSANLAIWNWKGINQYGTPVGDGVANRNIVFTNAASPNDLTNYLNRISFYSDSGSSFVGNAFEDSFSQPGFATSTEIIAVPEPETYLTGVILLLGLGIHQFRLARQGRGLLSRFTFLRQRGQSPELP